METLGVLLLNMGGPTSLDAVRPFLENLFLDKEIISFGPLEVARAPLARFIAKRRAAVVARNYAMIGGRSPLGEISARQAAALATELTARLAGRLAIRVAVGFSYWHPFISEAMDALEREGATRVFLMPLYPQYSKTTTGSCMKTWRDLHCAKGGRRFRVQSVKAYPADERYVAAINARIDEALAEFPEERRAGVVLQFSAHGTPVALVTQGDPYSRQIRDTVEAVMTARGKDRPYHLSFQSKVGPAKWLEPNTVGKTKQLAAEGVKDLLVIPIAFTADHIETLHELDIELRREAEEAGIERFAVTAGLNDSPLYISAMAGLIIDRMERRLRLETAAL